MAKVIVGRLGIFALLLLWSALPRADDYDSAATRDVHFFTLESRATGDTYEVHVVVPKAREQHQPVHVVVLTDFTYLKATDAIFERLDGSPLAPVLLVGLDYSNWDNDGFARRERDLALRPVAYYQFLSGELLPRVEREFAPVVERRTFMGHSYGGLFGIYALIFSALEPQPLFSNFIVSSPSLFANPGIYDAFEYVDSKTGCIAANLYMATGSAEATMVDDLHRLRGHFVREQYRQLNFQAKINRGQAHSTNYRTTFSRGLRWLLAQPQNKQCQANTP